MDILLVIRTMRVRMPHCELKWEMSVNMECRLMQVLEFGKLPRRTSFVIGEVVRVHVKDEFRAKHEVETAKLKVIGRLGGDLYCRITDIFEMKIPDALS